MGRFKKEGKNYGEQLIDLQGYSEKITLTSEIIGEGAAALLQSKIQDYWLSVEPGFLSSSDRGWAYRMRQPGDGALYLFERAGEAESFAVAVCKNAQDRNQNVSNKKWHHLFRAGIATGNIEWTSSGGEWIWCGPTANRPSRLEPAAIPGEIVIDSATFEVLPEHVRSNYSGPEMIKAKGESYQVYRRDLNTGSEVAGYVASGLLRRVKSSRRKRGLVQSVFALLTLGCALFILISCIKESGRPSRQSEPNHVPAESTNNLTDDTHPAIDIQSVPEFQKMRDLLYASQKKGIHEGLIPLVRASLDVSSHS